MKYAASRLKYTALQVLKLACQRVAVVHGALLWRRYRVRCHQSDSRAARGCTGCTHLSVKRAPQGAFITRNHLLTSSVRFSATAGRLPSIHTFPGQRETASSSR
jgi:hypothetical protein